MTKPRGYWTVFPCDQECGFARAPHVIPAGAPVRVISSQLLRCERHAVVPIDLYEITHAEQELLRAQARRADPAPVPAAFDSQRFRRDLAVALKQPREKRPVIRIRRPRPLRPYSGPQWDPKEAAAGGD